MCPFGYLHSIWPSLFPREQSLFRSTLRIDNFITDTPFFRFGSEAKNVCARSLVFPHTRNSPEILRFYSVFYGAIKSRAVTLAMVALLARGQSAGTGLHSTRGSLIFYFIQRRPLPKKSRLSRFISYFY